jgi:hypothetical protein
MGIRPESSDCESSAKHGCYTTANDGPRNAQIREAAYIELVSRNYKPDVQ